MRAIGLIRILLVLAVCLPAGAAEERLAREHWYELLIDQQKAGWMREALYDDGQRYRTVSETSLRVARGAAVVEISMRSQFLEARAGRPVEIEFTQRASAQTVLTRWIFHNDHLEQVVSQGGGEVRSRLPLPEGVWLMPAAADRYVTERMRASAAEFTFRTLEPESHGVQPVTVTYRRGPAEEYPDPSGRLLPVSVFRVESDALPGIPGKECYSTDGHLVYQAVESGMGLLVMRLVDEATARRPPEGPGPDLFAVTFVPLDRPIADPMSLSRARFRVRLVDGAMPALPSAGAQRVEPGPDGSLLLTIDIDDNHDASPGDAGDPQFTGPSSMVGSDDPLVRKLAESALRGAGGDAMARAEALRRHVHDHVSQKGFDTAFASAAETARTRRGDCSEHAVLLCAMLRAAAIPARVATGLVYVDRFGDREHVFGWHMWTQALIDGRWVDFDATLPGRHHAAHVLTSVSSLADHAGNADLASMMQMIGRLRIEVVPADG
jgi:transglutaminase-like putative cysteine protease